MVESRQAEKVETSQEDNIDPAILEIMQQYLPELMENSQPTEEE